MTAASSGVEADVEAESQFWFATAPVGAASLLAEELARFGATHLSERSTDVKFQGPLEVGYRACLWSRCATRVFLSLGSVDATSAKALYAGARRIDWRAHIDPGATLACDCSGGNDAIRHTVYGSQLLKDAVCDSLRDATGQRPDVRPEQPDVQLHLHVEGPQAVVSVDFAGESLHRRGYRTQTGRAPLKENLAAALLLRCGWNGPDHGAAALLDPMCGSGTILIEAAAMLADRAPALRRAYFGFLGWRGFDASLWQRLRDEAEARAGAITPRRCIVGYDIDAEAVHMSVENARAAGLDAWIHVEKRALAEIQSAPAPAGLLLTNPPYGERMGSGTGLPELYTELGRVMQGPMRGWQAGILTGNPPLAARLGVYAKRTHRFMNGAIDCRLLRFDLAAATLKGPVEPAIRAERALRPGAQMVANRLRKNMQRLEPWAAKAGIESFRAYDADMPEYAFAIDCYGSDPRHLFVQEYAAPKTVDAAGATARRRELLSVLPQVFEVPLTQIHTRIRRPQQGAAQYERRAASGERVVVNEAGLKFLVNFHEYLDTGLFLDHRITRSLVRDAAQGRDFLNLFCYTGSATVYAAAGSARRSLSIDLSNTYLQWARDNLELNGMPRAAHELLAMDCVKWLQAQTPDDPRFDLIFIDPPTFSNSKRMSDVFDVQRDHVHVLTAAARVLRPAGRMMFSTNYSRFKLDQQALRAAGLKCEDITARTIPVDFARNTRIHHCFDVTRCTDAAVQQLRGDV